jgi:hypothetical protein
MPIAVSRSAETIAAPLSRLDPVAAGDEVLEGAKRDHVGGEDRAGAGVIDRADMFGQPLEPGFDAGEIVGMGWGDHSGFTCGG